MPSDMKCKEQLSVGSHCCSCHYILVSINRGFLQQCTSYRLSESSSKLCLILMYWSLRDTSYIDGALQCRDTNKLCNSQKSMSHSHSTEQIYKILHHLHTVVGPTSATGYVVPSVKQHKIN
jgi:hypothetical protein